MTNYLQGCLTGLGLLWVLGGAVSCAPAARAEASTHRRAESKLPARVHRCADPRGSSRVTRAPQADGGEVLRGDSEMPSAPGPGGRLHLSESATLDGLGRLVGARIVATRPRSPVTTFVLEPLAGTVRMLREGASAVEWRVPADAPWVYRARSSGDGLLASTPVAAWLAARAAVAGPVVRVLVPETGESYLAPIDQLAIATETGTTVVLDGDGVDIDADFVTEARLSARGLRLACLEETSNVSRRAQGQ